MFGTTFTVGEELSEPGARVSISVNTISEVRQTANVIANTKQGRAKPSVVVGAHLDSVPESPGINDNGSSVATVLEMALQMSKLGIKPKNRVRFAFWGAEEFDFRGSRHYVSNLSDDELTNIGLYLNFEMLGSPNYVRFLYDGDGSDTPSAGPVGSAEIEKVFEHYFASKRLPTEPYPFDGRLDYVPFMAVGVPSGGLTAGFAQKKTEEQAAIYGGTAGEPYDHCYHWTCDDITNISVEVLDADVRRRSACDADLRKGTDLVCPSPTRAIERSRSVRWHDRAVGECARRSCRGFDERRHFFAR